MFPQLKSNIFNIFVFPICHASSCYDYIFRRKRKKKFQIPVSAYEYRMILDALMSSREKLMAQGRYTDAVDDALLAVCK